MTPLEWTGIGAGVLGFIVSFFTWASLDVNDGGALAMFGVDTTVSAWGAGFLGFFPILLLMATATAVLLPHYGVAVPRLGLNWLIGSGAAVLFILLRLLTLGQYVSPGAGLFIGLIVAIASTVAAFLTYRAEQAPAAGPASAA